MHAFEWMSVLAVAGCAAGGPEPAPDGRSDPVMASCADGFVRCDRLCLDARLVTADCRPQPCPTPPDVIDRPADGRGLAHQLAFDGDTLRITAQAGPASPVLTETRAIEVHVRVDGGATRSAPMVAVGDASWSHEIDGLEAGQMVEYYFTRALGPNTFHSASPGAEPTVDSAWFQRQLGAPSPVGRTHQLTVAARFRDRHFNEWRHDHYVAGYDEGATYTVAIADRGDAIDLTVTTDPAAEVGKVDLKWYETFGATPFCHDPPALAGVAAPGGMQRDGQRFTHTIAPITPGQLLDFELTFTDRPDGQPTYYSEWFHYYAGTGVLGQRVQDPRAYAAGQAAVSDVSVHQFAYAQHIPALGTSELDTFLAGKILFETDFDTGDLVNPPTAYDCNGFAITAPTRGSPRADDYAGALGPGYDSASCVGCHPMDGRGAMPDGLVVQLVPPDPRYGAQLSQRGAREGRLVIDYEPVTGGFGDGTPYELRRPRYRIEELGDGPLQSGLSVRVAPPIFGAGLLEAVPAEMIRGLADETDADGDGISGRVGGDGVTLGRFGWQALQPAVRDQVVAAFDHDMGLGATELDGTDADAVAAYVRGLSVPPREEYRTALALRGQRVFEEVGCASCHAPNLVTSLDHESAALAGQVIQPFSDLLLHDMGDELADASGREWRTSPLWGLGYAGRVAAASTDATTPNSGDAPGHFLHDGRARDLMEAVLWHGGEAATARDRVIALDAADRAALLAYLRYPFADPPPVGACYL